MKRTLITADELQEALKAIVAKEIADRAAESSARNFAALRGELASSLARANGWLSAAEKIAVLHRTSDWERRPCVVTGSKSRARTPERPSTRSMADRLRVGQAWKSPDYYSYSISGIRPEFVPEFVASPNWMRIATTIEPVHLEARPLGIWL